MEDKNTFINYVINLPEKKSIDKTIENIEEAIIIEYIRIYQYQDLRQNFEKHHPHLLFDLWVLTNNIISQNQKYDPVFFKSKKSSVNYADIILLENRELIKNQKELINEAIDQLKHKVKKDTKLSVSVGKNEVTLKRKGMEEYGITSLLLDKNDYDYLKELLNINNDLYIELYLLRISTIEISFYPPTLPEEYYDTLKKLGVKHQLFATPLNHQFDTYGSEFYDIDQFFGSVGSILKDQSAIKAINKSGAYEVNIIHYGPLHGMIIHKLNEILKTTSKAIMFYIVHDILVDDEQYHELDTYVRNITFLSKVHNNNLVNSRNLLILKSDKAKAPIEQDIMKLYSYLIDENSYGGGEIYTLPILTRYEKAYAIGKRAEQLALGAPPTINIDGLGITDVLLVAEMELEQKKMPFIIHRPDQDWDINMLKDYDSGNYLYDQGPSSYTS